LLADLGTNPNVLLGLLTGNVRDGARLKLGHYKLYHHFAFGGFGDAHFDRDDVAHEALAALHHHVNGSGTVEQIWVVGDTPLDIRCARAINARVLAVATGLHSREELEAEGPDLMLTDLSDPSLLMKTLPAES
jgi:phosphoglycolate phosphatase-like HAD superfamily hydrolase